MAWTVEIADSGAKAIGKLNWIETFSGVSYSFFATDEDPRRIGKPLKEQRVTYGVIM